MDLSLGDQNGAPQVEEAVVVGVASTDSSTEFSQQPPAKKLRKKSQAFGEARTAALKALIDQNARDSPLLGVLPKEVRMRIWKLVVGGQLLHVEKIVRCAKHANRQHCLCKDRPWGTYCCLSPFTETELFQRSKIPFDELVNQDEAEYGAVLGPLNLLQLPKDPAERREARSLHLRNHPHDLCEQFIGAVRAGKHDELEGHQRDVYRNKQHIFSPQLLRVCRQIYIEANPLLWSSNTLSFHNPQEFSEFMSELNAAQKASITSLALEFQLSIGRHHGLDERGTTNGIIKSLVGLKSLHLYLAHDRIDSHPAPIFGPMPPTVEEWWSQIRGKEDRAGFAKYKHLPLQNVTVVMFEHFGTYEGYQVPGGFEPAAWYHAEKFKYTESVRQAILDSEGANKLAQEQAVEKAAEQAETAAGRRAYRPCEKASTAAECKQLRLEKRTKWAKTPARACGLEHVCLFCLEQLQRSRDEAAACPHPGRCDDHYFQIMVHERYCIEMPIDRSTPVFVCPEDTIFVARERWLELLNDGDNVAWYPSFRDTRLQETWTIAEVMQKFGVISTDELELTLDFATIHPAPVKESDEPDESDEQEESNEPEEVDDAETMDES